MEKSRHDEIGDAQFNLEVWLIESDLQSKASWYIAMYSDSGDPVKKLNECLVRMKECEERLNREPDRWGEFSDFWIRIKDFWAKRAEKWQNHERN